MFTGLVTAVGRVRSAKRDRSGGIDLEIGAPFRKVELGESIAVDGVCLTVTRKARGGFGVRVVATTLDRTLLGLAQAGQRVNLERAAVVGDRLGGHLVQGHVDGMAKVVAIRQQGDARLVDLRVPRAVATTTIPLGSITVAGVSLTVNAMPRPGIIQVSLIPHTLTVTTLGNLGVGDRVHVEGDVIGKYLKGLMKGTWALER